VLPVAAVAIASFVKTQKDQSASPAKNFAANDNVAIDQLSLLLAGGVGNHFGGFSQFTYDGVDARFDGASADFDGLGRNASDNNTLRLFLWLAF